MINSRGKRVVREAVFLPTFVFVRVEDKNLNEIHFRSDVYKMLSEPGKSAPYAIPDTKFDNFSEREFEEKVSPILGHSVHFCQDNESMSSYGVMRSLHFQCPPYTQSNLVRCVKVESSMIPLVSIGKSQQNMPISQRKIRSMQC